MEAGLGSGKVEGKSITSQFIQLTYQPNLKLSSFLGGDLGMAFGLRSGHYSADLFQASDVRSEYLKDIDIYAHNLFGQIHFQRDIFQFGFNLDLIGISSKDNALINGTNQRIQSETFNLFLFGSNDKGTLNSQLFAAVKYVSFIFKLGLSHSLISYKKTGLSGDQDRMRFFDFAFFSLGHSF